MRFQIDVTTEDIRRGKRRHPHSCAVARAVQRVLGPLWFVGSIKLCKLASGKSPGDLSRVYEVLAPDEVYWFIQRFDAYKEVEPFSFTITIPDEYCAEAIPESMIVGAEPCLSR